jgi:hypothetical protein
MALQEAQVVVQFRGGVETKEDRKGVLPTKLLALENAVFSKVLSTVKRFGYDDLGVDVMGSDEPLPEILALGRRGDELLAFSADQVFSWIGDTERWIAAGDVRSVMTRLETVAKTGTNQVLADVCINDGVALYAWEDSAGGSWYALLDDETGRTLVAPTQISALATRPRCVALGAYLFVLYAMVTAGELRLLRFSHDEPTAAPHATILVTDLSATSPHVDLATHGDNAVFAYVRDTGSVRVGYLHASGVIGGTGLGLAIPITISTTCTSALSIASGGADRILVAWPEPVGAGNLRFLELDDDLVVVNAEAAAATTGANPTQVTCAYDGQDEGGDPSAWVFYELTAAAAQNRTVTGTRVAGGAVVETWTQRGCGLVSKAFTHDTDCYVHLGRDSTLYRTYYTMRARGQLVVTRLLSGIGNGHLTKAHLPTVSYDSATAEWFWPAIYVTDVDSGGGEVFGESGITKVELAFASAEAFRSVELGATTYIAGGLLQAYDGRRVVEAEFHYGIDDIAAPTQGAATSTGLAAGTYNYVFVLENTLANGEIQRGPVSAPVTVTVAGADRRVTFAIPTYRLTAMPSARIAVFRTIDGDEATYSRVTSYNPTTAGTANGFVANSTTTDTVTFFDEMTDAVLEAQEPLYINGDIPPNDPLGGARFVAAGKGRAFVVDASAPCTVFYTQQRADGYALESTPRLRFEVDPLGGDITGIDVMDESIVVLKETAVFHVTGPGPLANPAAGGGWSEPELIPSDVGCVTPDSVCLTPIGLTFKSQKGIELLGRDRAIAMPRLGASVEGYLAQDVTAATLVEDKTEIRYLTSSGSTLLYDYERGQWSTFKNHEGRDAILVGGTYHYLRNNGRVWRQSSSFADGGTAQIKKAVETAWINLVGHLQGQWRVWYVTIIGEHKSPHGLLAYTGFDYQDGWTGDPIRIDPTEGRTEGLYGSGVYGAGVYGGAADTRYQFAIHVGQECQAIRFRFEDVEADGAFGASFELSELHISGAVERSSFTVEEARRY